MAHGAVGYAKKVGVSHEAELHLWVPRTTESIQPLARRDSAHQIGVWHCIHLCLQLNAEMSVCVEPKVGPELDAIVAY